MKIENKVMDEFFARWEKETVEWFARMKAEAKEVGAYQFAKENKYGISKANLELIRFHPMTATKGHAYSIEEIVRLDMESKKEKVYDKVTKKVGEITEVNLHCGEDGTPNGMVKGTEGAATIRTIVAGGYHIQCLHYRVLVK